MIVPWVCVCVCEAECMREIRAVEKRIGDTIYFLHPSSVLEKNKKEKMVLRNKNTEDFLPT